MKFTSQAMTKFICILCLIGPPQVHADDWIYKDNDCEYTMQFFKASLFITGLVAVAALAINATKRHQRSSGSSSYTTLKLGSDDLIELNRAPIPCNESKHLTFNFNLAVHSDANERDVVLFVSTPDERLFLADQTTATISIDNPVYGTYQTGILLEKELGNSPLTVSVPSILVEANGTLTTLDGSDIVFTSSDPAGTRRDLAQFTYAE